MVNYTYVCPDCNKETEYDHSIFEDPKIPCDKCIVQMRRRIFKTGINVQCGGFVGKLNPK